LIDGARHVARRQQVPFHFMIVFAIPPCFPDIRGSGHLTRALRALSLPPSPHRSACDHTIHLLAPMCGARCNPSPFVRSAINRSTGQEFSLMSRRAPLLVSWSMPDECHSAQPRGPLVLFCFLCHNRGRVHPSSFASRTWMVPTTRPCSPSIW
jgi:hypothetical protein